MTSDLFDIDLFDTVRVIGSKAKFLKDPVGKVVGIREVKPMYRLRFDEGSTRSYAREDLQLVDSE